jgi:hypothetical protein
LSIGHEVYAVPAGRWENIYMNYPESNFGKSLSSFLFLLSKAGIPASLTICRRYGSSG